MHVMKRCRCNGYNCPDLTFRSLYEEHRLLFATLLCINIQYETANIFSEEELALLLQGRMVTPLFSHVPLLPLVVPLSLPHLTPSFQIILPPFKSSSIHPLNPF